MKDRETFLNDLLNRRGQDRPFKSSTDLPPNTDESKSRILKNILADYHKKEDNQRFLTPKFYYLAAACSIIVLISFVVILFSTNVSDSLFDVKNGDKAESFNLEKNSIFVNTGSQLKYSKRLLSADKFELTGESFFDVKGNSIEVKAGTIMITTEAGRFNVYNRDGQTIIQSVDATLYVKGLLNNVDQEEVIYPGTELTVSKGIPIRGKVFTEDIGKWTEGEFSYKSTDLFLVLNEIERQFQVSIKRDGVPNKPVTVRFFRKEGWKGSLDKLASAGGFGYEYIPDQNSILLRSLI